MISCVVCIYFIFIMVIIHQTVRFPDFILVNKNKNCVYKKKRQISEQKLENSAHALFFPHTHFITQYIMNKRTRQQAIISIEF
jgi:hypothetical protein